MKNPNPNTKNEIAELRDILENFNLPVDSRAFEIREEQVQKDLDKWLASKSQEVAREAEINRIEITLSRIRLNEANDYPIVDESKNLADVKEALINRLAQLKGENHE